jgi:hypothetical protein
MGMRAVKDPPFRRLRIYAFDPSASTDLATAVLNEAVVKLPWEGELEPGPCGEYVEVLDVDPASQAVYEPVDLNAIHLLAQDGFPPSEGNPGFHQQMVYAVAMMTIRNFERALGRRVFWSARYDAAEPAAERSKFVRRLRIYPHALREANAYYSPNKKALLFGYFPASRERPGRTLPGGTVFTCLSNDIVAHETTHAILDGLHRRYLEPSNPDVLAFHEAFADIVALFQHFTMPEAVRHQITRMRGNLGQRSLLSDLARQFGEAIGHYGALRSAIGEVDKATGEPDPTLINRTFEPHARGAILVAAVFRAFLLIYRARTADLFRIASQGTGKLPEGEIHPDLTARLAQEAARCADRVLQMCIRAIDYCPPVDITFGDFMRGVITADLDYSPEDKENFRIVFVESFREWGISPRGVSSMGVDALAWPSGDELTRELVADSTLEHQHQDLRVPLPPVVVDAMRKWNLESERFEVWRDFEHVRRRLRSWLSEGDSVGRDYARVFGLVIDEHDKPPPTVARTKDGPAVEIHAARPALRRTATSVSTDLVIEITQRRDGYFDEAEQKQMDDALPTTGPAGRPAPDFRYRAGVTLLIDPTSLEVRRVIRTAGTIVDDAQLDRVRRFLLDGGGGSGNAFDGGVTLSRRDRDPTVRREQFALLHQLEGTP